MKILAVLSALLMLSGCMTTLRELPTNDYNFYSDLMAYSERCLKMGEVSPELMGSTIHNLGVSLSMYSYDVYKLKQMGKDKYSRISNQWVDCKSVQSSMQYIVQRGERIQRNQEIQSQQPKEESRSTIRSTYCNKTGDSVFCSSF